MECIYCGEEIPYGTYYIETNKGPVEADCFADYIEENLEEYGFEKKKHVPNDDPFAGRNL
jgi:hypothetical protein